jgi:hypothetical protein
MKMTRWKKSPDLICNLSRDTVPFYLNQAKAKEKGESWMVREGWSSNKDPTHQALASGNSGTDTMKTPTTCTKESKRLRMKGEHLS